MAYFYGFVILVANRVYKGFCSANKGVQKIVVKEGKVGGGNSTIFFFLVIKAGVTAAKVGDLQRI